MHMSFLNDGPRKGLIKFCEDHGYDVGGVNELRSCLKALANKDMKSAMQAYQRVPLGGMGRFDDWLPPVVFPHENADYSPRSFRGSSNSMEPLNEIIATLNHLKDNVIGKG